MYICVYINIVEKVSKRHSCCQASAGFSPRAATPSESRMAIRAEGARVMKQEAGRPGTGY